MKVDGSASIYPINAATTEVFTNFFYCFHELLDSAEHAVIDNLFNFLNEIIVNLLWPERHAREKYKMNNIRNGSVYLNFHGLEFYYAL